MGCSQCNYLYTLLSDAFPCVICSKVQSRLQFQNFKVLFFFFSFQCGVMWLELTSGYIYILLLLDNGHLFSLLLQPSYCLQAYTGHSSPVMSLDFHPKKTDLFCFCDEKNEIRYWNISPFSCTHVSKVGFIVYFPLFSVLYSLKFLQRTDYFLIFY